MTSDKNITIGQIASNKQPADFRTDKNKDMLYAAALKKFCNFYSLLGGTVYAK